MKLGKEKWKTSGNIYVNLKMKSFSNETLKFSFKKFYFSYILDLAKIR